jgi:prevent-host-death family protein
METTSISQLKASLSHYLKTVRAGEEVLITDRGRAVAKIIPLEKDEREIPPHLRELERSGLARIGSGKITDEFWDLPRPGVPEGAALKALLDEREEGW